MTTTTKLTTSGKDVTNLKNVGYENGVSLGNEINKGEFIQSPQKQFTLQMQTDFEDFE